MVNGIAAEPNSLLDHTRKNGVVGAGGAGFPTYAKLKNEVDTFIVNAAECEPLLHKDKELLRHRAGAVLEGTDRIRAQLKAGEAVIGIKRKYEDIIEQLTPLLPPTIRVHPLDDYYPVGDEVQLIYEITGRVVPRGGLPMMAGAMVMNVETILNAALDRPVTTKFMTVAGAVANPVTVEIPIGMSLREALEACGGATVHPFAALVGGAMMGKLAEDLDQPVTKTTGGLIILPEDHPLIQKYRRDRPAIRRIGRSACDQCTFCTELCPRYLLGHPIEPHKAMRSLGFSHETNTLVLGSQFCCECNLCSLIACPEDLDPKNVCVINKGYLKENGLAYPADIPDRPPHSMREARRAPLSRVIAKIGLGRYENKGPLTAVPMKPEFVRIPLKQHVGVPAAPAVKAGDRVEAGQVIATVDEKDLGVPVHASIGGVVESVGNGEIAIRRA